MILKNALLLASLTAISSQGWASRPSAPLINRSQEKQLLTPELAYSLGIDYSAIVSNVGHGSIAVSVNELSGQLDLSVFDLETFSEARLDAALTTRAQ